MKKPILIAVVGLILIFVFNYAYTQERITLSTYYPAPYGEYRKLAIGSSTGGYTAPSSADIDLVVEGSVGIGTTGPGGKLTVSQDKTTYVETDNHLRLQGSTDPNKMLSLGFHTADNVGWIQSLQYGTATKPLVLQPNGGNVGIGTTGPQSKLTIEDDSTVGRQLILQETTDPNFELYLGWDSDGDFGAIQAFQQATGVRNLVLQQEGGNVGIGTTTPQAKLDVSSTTSGFLPPRMTTVQRNNISSPPAGSVIYNTNENGLNLYNGSNWQGGGWIKLAEVDLSGSGGYTFTNLNGNTHKVYKVIFQGRLAAGGNQRILIRPNGSSAGYRCRAVLNGDASGGEWEFTGFYVGRGAWSQNADVIFEYTISAMSGRRHVGFGESTFAHYPTSIIGFIGLNGYWDSTANITSLWVGPMGGSISGKLILMALQ